jgi:hypothetical protein
MVTTTRGPLNTGSDALTSGTVPAGHVIRLFKGFQRTLEPTETPLTNAIASGGTVNQKKVEWGQEFLSPHQVTLGGAVADASTTALTLAAGEGSRITLTDLIQIESEVVWVKAFTSADVLVVARGMGGTTAAAHTLNDDDGEPRVLELISTAAQENADTPLTPVPYGTTAYNYPQLIDQAIQVSDREDNTPDYEYDDGSRYDAMLEKVMSQVAIKFEKLLFRGKRGVESSMVVGTGTPTLMGGLDYFTTNIIPLAGAPLTEATILQMVRESYDRIGQENTPKDIWAGSLVFDILSRMWNEDRTSDQQDTTRNLVWTQVRTPFGVLKFHLSRYVAPGDLYLMDNSDPNQHPYAGYGEWHERVLPANGPYKRGRFTGDRTTTWRGEQKRVKVTGASTDLADYDL